MTELERYNRAEYEATVNEDAYELLDKVLGDVGPELSQITWKLAQMQQTREVLRARDLIRDGEWPS